MSIIKRSKSNFGVVPKAAMSNPNMSLKAKGLLSYLLCMPDDWQIYVSQLSKVHKESKNTIAKIINELIEHGYVTREQKRGDANRFAGYDYSVYDIPVSQETVSQKAVSQKTVHGKLVTTKKDLTKEKDTKKDNNASLPFSSSSFQNAWDEWQEHRKQKRKPLTAIAKKKQLAMLKELGEKRAIDALNHSMTQGWEGIYEKQAKQPQAIQNAEGVKAPSMKKKVKSEYSILDSIIK